MFSIQPCPLAFQKPEHSTFGNDIGKCLLLYDYSYTVRLLKNSGRVFCTSPRLHRYTMVWNLKIQKIAFTPTIRVIWFSLHTTKQTKKNVIQARYNREDSYFVPGLLDGSWQLNWQHEFWSLTYNITKDAIEIGTRQQLYFKFHKAWYKSNTLKRWWKYCLTLCTKLSWESNTEPILKIVICQELRSEIECLVFGPHVEH